MTILFTGRKADLKPGLKTLAERKLEKLERLLHENPDAHIILTQEKHRHLAEIIVRARVGTLTAKADGADFQESLHAIGLKEIPKEVQGRIALAYDRAQARAKLGKGAWPVNEILKISGPFERFLREAVAPEASGK